MSQSTRGGETRSHFSRVPRRAARIVFAGIEDHRRIGSVADVAIWRARGQQRCVGSARWIADREMAAPRLSISLRSVMPQASGLSRKFSGHAVGTTEAIRERSASPYADSFAGPMPGTLASSSTERGRLLAIASRVLSCMTTNGGTARSRA
jgi:hypothetical protein